MRAAGVHRMMASATRALGGIDGGPEGQCGR
jgi:hypothetical protein